MTTATSLDLLRLEPAGDGRFLAPEPEASPEGGNVMYGGQLLAQLVAASYAHSDDGKYLTSMNTVFSRAGSYGSPLHLVVEPFHTGRTFASETISAWQGDRLLSRALAMRTSDEPDLVAHQLERPAHVPDPEQSGPARGIVFPGADARSASAPDATAAGVPSMAFWTRMPELVGSLAASQAILAWATNGWFIELAMRPHLDTVRIEDAHATLTTGVVNHTLTFHREFDAGAWLLLCHEATYAGKGRCHGRGTVFREDGTLVATFAQSSMIKPGGRSASSPL